ncbi:protein of unknown function (DUF4803) [Popillia japonica]|uniref:Uncharacterized protein n=1 Tax=Popillia japonica TaxID=7064 RepID=A0AAW1MKF3_POPJA
MIRYCVLLLAFLWIPNSEQSETFSSIAVFAQNLIKSDWKTVEDRSYLQLNKTIEQKQARISRKIRNVGEVLWQLEQPISPISCNVSAKFIQSIANNSRDRTMLRDFHSYMYRIDRDLKQLQEYSEKNNSLSMIDFANAAISNQPNSTKLFLEKIHQQIMPKITYKSRGGLMKMLADNIEAFDAIVRINEESPNQLLYNLFNKIVLTQIKGYAIIQFSYAILEIHDKGYYLKESKLAKKEIRDKLQELFNETIQTTAKLSRDYWRHDPDEYKRGENYLELTKLLQGYVVNEKLLNRDQHCYGQCKHFKEISIFNCQTDPFCRKQARCNGKAYHCRSLNPIDMQICPAPRGNTRRYDYIEYDNHDILGVKSNCSTSLINLDGLIGWCPYCMCFCDDQDFSSDRFFSLRQVVSDTKQNKVVTGIRFAKKNKMIHLQVQQGEILPYGVINVTSLEWVPIDNFKINDRRFTPLQFGKNPKDKRTHLNLEIRMTKFHFESGRLFPTSGSHTWYRNLKTEFSPYNSRTRIPTEDLDIPTKTKSRNTIVSKGDQFVEFTHTDITKDVGQTTIPFIDSQDVVTKVPTPLVGAGLYYKSSPGYGGFIGLKIVTYNFTQHL